MSKKRNKIIPITLAILILSAIVIGAIIFIVPTQGILSFEDVYKANYGNICCEKKGAYDIIITRYADDVSSTTCDHFTDECDVSIDYIDLATLSCGNAIYKIDGGVERPISKVTTTNVKLQQGQTISFKEKFCIGKDSLPYIQWTKKAKTFYIKGQENGQVFTQESCILNSELKKRVLSGGLNQLNFDECQSYIIDFIQTATRTYSYSGQEVVCQARRLYSVENRQFKDGSTRKIQGNQITSVECCPAEANCDVDTFEFVEVNVKECTFDTECPNGGNPVADTGTSYVEWNCQNEKCVQSSPIIVECTNNAVCIAKNNERSVCDLSSINYGTCKDSTDVPGYCGDGVCESILGETTSSCPIDCGPQDPLKLAWWVWVLIVVGAIIVLFIIYMAIKFYISIAVLSRSRPPRGRGYGYY